ncbi:MAG: PIG-L deacetylase family protein [Polynucleobacter sp.]|uniref:PIG-L deacetylase family protein n=1 Tax=Polynucleobacter sp. JS-JIR-II-50 TaxID=2576919 RepID=UPI001BFE4509|nr:PIG-L deacetylase family protein [Polynucleobacter sp. JS-JIR-II-50]QWE04793.1 PIG-L family deacetylase [Polynucleobacter sp. JS-JIR-II-50]
MNVLIVVPHPDDEVLGCGGSIARHISQGDSVTILILAEGITSRANTRELGRDSRKLQALRGAALKASKILGVTDTVLHDFPDNRMDGLQLLDVVKVVEKHVNRLRPTVVYTTFSGDVNIDHQICYRAVVTACRPQPGMSVTTLLVCETLSSTEWQPPVNCTQFSPNFFIDITSTLSIKLRALEAYKAELREWPHPRSLKAVENLATYRGSSVGINAAEAFMLARCIY